jgi:hypothetical protein
MNNKKVGQSFNDFYLQTDAEMFRDELTTSFEHPQDLSLRNGAPARAIVAHEELFKIMNQAVIFSRGFKKNIFDNENVINSFTSRIKNILDNRVENSSVIKIIIKETKDKIDGYMKNSEFCKAIKKQSQDYGNFIEIYHIDPEIEITPPSVFLIQENEKNKVYDFSVIQNKDSLKVADLNTFELFNLNHIRLRTCTKENHNSDALINSGKSEEQINKLNDLFNYLLNKSTKYEEKKIENDLGAKNNN